MFRYNNLPRVDVDGIDDTQNSMLLRSDAHTIYDQKKFVIVPKPVSTTSQELSYVAHVLTPGVSFQLIKLYHNVALQQLTGIATEFLFARLAWTFFSFSRVFLQPGVKRILCICEDGQTKTKEFSGEQCRLLVMKGRSRSVSPKKRKPETSDILQEGTWDIEQERGRKRRRASSSSSAESSPRESHWCTDSSLSTADTYSSTLKTLPEVFSVAKEAMTPPMR